MWFIGWKWVSISGNKDHGFSGPKSGSHKYEVWNHWGYESDIKIIYPTPV